MNPVSLFFFGKKFFSAIYSLWADVVLSFFLQGGGQLLSNLNKNNQNSPSPQKNQIIYQLIKLINHCSFICNYYWKSIDRSIDKLFESNECDIYLTKNYDNLRIMERKLNAREREFIMPNDNIWKFFSSFWWSNWFKSSIHTLTIWKQVAKKWLVNWEKEEEKEKNHQECQLSWLFVCRIIELQFLVSGCFIFFFFNFPEN